MLTIDARRQPGAGVDQLHVLNGRIGDLRKARTEAREALAGCMDDLWIDRYLAERVEPILEEFDEMLPRVRQMNPLGVTVWQEES